jgi:hypothetical protein
MKFFTKLEFRNISLILVVLLIFYLVNISASLRKGRDITRKDDISNIQKALASFKDVYKAYPLSNEKGEILACFDDHPVLDTITGVPTNAVPCFWGDKGFMNITVMPRDPDSKNGASYRYVSDGKSYKFYVSLEGKKEPEYSLITEKLNLQCGNKICNYSRGDKE